MRSEVAGAESLATSLREVEQHGAATSHVRKSSKPLD